MVYIFSHNHREKLADEILSTLQAQKQHVPEIKICVRLSSIPLKSKFFHHILNQHIRLIIHYHQITSLRKI